MIDESRAMAEVRDLFAELDALFKNPDLGSVLIARGINTSLAMVAADALRAYVEGDKARAAEDFATVAEEIARRHAETSATKS